MQLEDTRHHMRLKSGDNVRTLSQIKLKSKFSILITMNNTFPHSPSLSFFPPSALLSSLLLPPYPSFLPPLFLSYLYYMLCSDNFGWT